MTMQAIWQGVVLAQSDDTVVVEGNHYFPRKSLNAEYFTESDHTSMCSWKGKASYLSVAVGDAVNQDAAWKYDSPLAEAQAIEGHVAFWRGVDVTSVD